MTTLVNINGVTRDISELTLPASRLFRDAWQLEGDVVTIDTAKAAAIQREKITAEAERRRNLLASPNKQMEALAKAAVLNSVPEASRDETHAAATAALVEFWGGFELLNQRQETLEGLSDADLMALDVTADENWSL